MNACRLAILNQFWFNVNNKNQKRRKRKTRWNKTRDEDSCNKFMVPSGVLVSFGQQSSCFSRRTNNLWCKKAIKDSFLNKPAWSAEGKVNTWWCSTWEEISWKKNFDEKFLCFQNVNIRRPNFFLELFPSRHLASKIFTSNLGRKENLRR